MSLPKNLENPVKLMSIKIINFGINLILIYIIHALAIQFINFWHHQIHVNKSFFTPFQKKKKLKECRLLPLILFLFDRFVCEFICVPWKLSVKISDTKIFIRNRKKMGTNMLFVFSAAALTYLKIALSNSWCIERGTKTAYINFMDLCCQKI